MTINSPWYENFKVLVNFISIKGTLTGILSANTMVKYSRTIFVDLIVLYFIIDITRNCAILNIICDVLNNCGRIYIF